MFSLDEKHHYTYKKSYQRQVLFRSRPSLGRCVVLTLLKRGQQHYFDCNVKLMQEAVDLKFIFSRHRCHKKTFHSLKGNLESLIIIKYSPSTSINYLLWFRNERFLDTNCRNGSSDYMPNRWITVPLSSKMAPSPEKSVQNIRLSFGLPDKRRLISLLLDTKVSLEDKSAKVNQ